LDIQILLLHSSKINTNPAKNYLNILIQNFAALKRFYDRERKDKKRPPKKFKISKLKKF